jgi:hypothetical protein
VEICPAISLICGVCWFCVVVVHAFRSKPVEVSGKESMWFLLGVIMKMVKLLPSLLIYTATDLGGHEFGHVYKLRATLVIIREDHWKDKDIALSYRLGFVVVVIVDLGQMYD